jgi:predicted RNase H-like HicB family nuclease
MKYVYPAVFTKEESGLFSIDFPDVKNCFTGGQDIDDGYKMAEDVLCFTLYEMEREGKALPQSTDPLNMAVSENSFIALIGCDTEAYRRTEKSRSVKKTLTIPEWLDEMAVNANLNFSRVLQEGLKKELHIL